MNDPANPGPSTAPLNPNTAPDDDSTFNAHLDVADLRPIIDLANLEDPSIQPEIDTIPVPTLLSNTIYVPAIKFADLIDAYVSPDERRLLIVSFHELSSRAVMPILTFGKEEGVPLVVMAAAQLMEWALSLSSETRILQPIMMCYPGKGLKRRLGNFLTDADDVPTNALYLIDRPRDGKRTRFLQSWLPERVDAPHDLTGFRETASLALKLPVTP